MLRYTLTLFCSLFLLFFVNIATAQQKPRWIQRLNPDTLVNREVSLIPVPILQSSPETGLRVGVSMDYFFNTSKEIDSLQARDSFAWLTATYSTRKQLVIEPVWQIYTRNEKFLLRGQAGYADFSEYFWDIGNDAFQNNQFQSLFYSRVHFQGEFLRQIVPNIFGGLQIQASNTNNITYQESLRNILAEVAGNRGSYIAGIGPNVIFDFRDNPFSPLKGWFLELSYTAHHPIFTSKYTYQETLIDARKYFLFRHNQSLGFQALGSFATGEVPLRELARLGGNQIMRGMVQGRYRDKNTLSAQGEYKKSLNRFLKVAAFVSSGVVGDQISDFSSKNLHYGYGVGLRILVNKKKNLYTRIDIARSSEGNTAFYLRLMDAF